MGSKVKDSTRNLRAKEKVYNTLETKRHNLGKLLVDFEGKPEVEEEEEGYRQLREDFYAGKLSELRDQKEGLGDNTIEEKDIRERLAWERELYAEMKGDVVEDEKVKQVFDRRMKGDERQALDEVLKELSEEERQLCEVRKRREELEAQKRMKLEKLKQIACSREEGAEETRSKQ